MSITPLPALDRLSANFRSDVDAFFGSALPTMTNELNAELARINTIASGSYTATSTTSLMVGTGEKILTITPGKSFGPGQAVVIAQTSSPTNYMAGRVTEHDAATGAMTVDVISRDGGGTAADWTITVTALPPLSGPEVFEFPSSGTFTKPAGAKLIIVELLGAGGGGGTGVPSVAGHTGGRSGGGGGAGGCYNRIEFCADVLPATVAVTIGAGGLGAPGTSGDTNGGDGGMTSFGVYAHAYGGVGGQRTVASGGGGAYGAGSYSGEGGVGDGYQAPASATMLFATGTKGASAYAAAATSSLFGGAGGGATNASTAYTGAGSLGGGAGGGAGGGFQMSSGAYASSWAGAPGGTSGATPGIGFIFGTNATAGGSSGQSTCTAGANGVTTATGSLAGAGGGGGGGRMLGAGAAGGNGGRGCGGGGGGAGQTSTTLGDGGNGGNGYVRITVIK